jgi:Resolvase, N terminal domain
MIFGYARVSTGSQSLATQDAALRTAGCGKIYSEKESGAKTDRAELQKLLTRLDEDDMLIVTRLDRLARSTRDLLNTLDVISKAGAKFRSLNDPWADTCTTWRVNGHDPCWPRHLRAPPDSRQNRRRPTPGKGPRRSHGTTVKTHTASAERGRNTP